MQARAIRWLDEVSAEPWRNGGGTTRTLASVDGEWRVSLADITRDGPYSRFAGMVRLSVIVSGQGVMLRTGATVIPLRPMTPTRYDGDIEWEASLIDGPSVALNTMVRHRHYRVHAWLDADVIVPAGMTAIILAGQCGCTVSGGPSQATARIVPGQYLVVHEPLHPLAVRQSNAGSKPSIVVMIERLRRDNTVNHPV